MNRTLSLRSGLLLLPLIAAVQLVGCGGESAPQGTVVRGKILKGGQPITIDDPTAESPMVQVLLIPTFSEAGEEPADLAADGSFEIVGPGNGIVPGKYKIAVEARASFSAPDKLNGKFSAQNTPIVRDIQGTQMDLGTIDLDRVP